ncbi:branched-chain amino acid ABC transporter substrate-binding protein [Rhizobium sp. BK251]|uniref:branched-chain amino acid ABC transporter substrate-binding protein n=1 Tax=Rhizobium sp. BK251 TaxID=2512125 RepID=UPI001050AD78|nr:branched-chain amino acid ABC transporter substrate-binding protein [Rhizobium sp. BK251]TCL73570.1 amino acid/amide ABC transporter substrate-binding protein (HAAT family) [Rhizobium sp. BK251]
MKVLRLIGISAALLLAAQAGHAAGVAIGVVVPQQGPYAAIGAQISAGAGLAADQSKNAIITVNEPCEDGSGQAVADALVNAKVQIAIGFVCTETLEGALPRLKDAGIPAITVSVRSRILMEDAVKNGWPLFRLAPPDGAEAQKIIDVIIKDWAGEPIALVEDGTIHGRELTEAVRDALEDKGLKPVFTDTYRPGQEQQIALVRRLKRAGATHVFIGGDRSDAAIIARDAAAEKIPLVVLGGDALRAADQPVPLAEGVLAVTLPDYSLLPAAQAVVTALRAAGIEPEGYVLPAYAAATIADQAVQSAVAQGKPVAEKLIGTTFQTVLGPLSFNPAHELAENPYQLLEWRAKTFRAPGSSTD